jgi:hypothetical protein
MGRVLIEEPYRTGATTSDLNGPFVGGFSDAYLMKLDPLGNTLWSKQIASDNLDLGRGVAIGDLGSIYVTGRTKGDLYGSALGSDDGFIVKFAIIPEPTTLTLSLLAIAYRPRSRRRC